jgi:hypothetical protein
VRGWKPVGSVVKPSWARLPYSSDNRTPDGTDLEENLFADLYSLQMPHRGIPLPGDSVSVAEGSEGRMTTG